MGSVSNIISRTWRLPAMVACPGVTLTAASGTIAPMTFSTAAAHTARTMPGLPMRPCCSSVPPTVSSSQAPPSAQYTVTAA
jgi:hypothetical protein